MSTTTPTDPTPTALGEAEAPRRPPHLFFVGAQLRAILDAIPSRVALYDRERRHRYVNRQYAAHVGRAPEEVVGLTLEEVMGREIYDRLAPFYLQLRPHSARALAGEISRWEGWLPFSALQEPSYVQRLYLPYRGRAGRVEGYFVFSRDLTELKRSEALNAAITASALDCIIVADETGRIVAFNPAAERSFGHARDAVLGRPVDDLLATRDPAVPGLARFLDAAGPERRMEVKAVRADGSRFPAELAIAEVRLADRRLFTAYLRDLAPAHAAAAEIERQREALMQAEKLAALGSLLAGVAHELNNPLSIVLARALMLQEELAAAGLEAQAERAERIRVAAERCARIVRSFLAMARRQATQPRAVPFAPLVGAALELLAYGLRSDGVEVVQEIPDDLPPLRGDPDQLHQVLVNLVANARQALEGQAGPRRIRLSARNLGDMVEVTVADNGPGVVAAIRGRIFDPFFTTKPPGSGTGIGLAVSRGVAEAHGGTLDLVGPEGPGARFVLRLPRAVAEDAAELPAEPVGIVDAAAPATGRTALVIDDEAEVGEVLTELLGGLGYRCDRAATGREAKRLLAPQAGRDYDVILCDLRMPDMGGAALHAWLEKQRPVLAARIAFITGDTLGHGAGAFLARSGRPVLEKPFAPQEVRRLVAALQAGG